MCGDETNGGFRPYWMWVEVRRVRPRLVRLETAMYLALVSQNYHGATQDLLSLCQLLRCYSPSLNFLFTERRF